MPLSRAVFRNYPNLSIASPGGALRDIFARVGKWQFVELFVDCHIRHANVTEIWDASDARSDGLARQADRSRRRVQATFFGPDRADCEPMAIRGSAGRARQATQSADV